MSTVPKIIIKPRLIVPPPHQSTSTAPTPPSRAEDADDEDNEGAYDDENIYDDNMDVDGSQAGGPLDDDDPDSRLGTPTLKGRGRLRVRGRGSGIATPTRGRGKLRGRGRGRGPKTAGALTIKLPRRGDDEGEADDVGVEAEESEPKEQEIKEDTPMEAEVEEGPIGGGKPFRRINGKVHVIDSDEFVTEDDPRGDEKIDKWGNLLGGRRFKAYTFVLPNRHPQRQYMLAIDAARTSGFRDSLYYFRRNALAFKLNATQPEKDYLISEGKLGSHLRTRSVTLVTARSAFKLHGSKMIIDGRWVTDDYYEEKVLEEITAKGLKAGDPVGELPDPNAPRHTEDPSLAAGAGAGKGERGSGGGIYRAGGPTTIFGGSGLGPYSDGPLNAVRKSLLSRDGVTEENWMHMMAIRVLDAGDEWGKYRKEALRPWVGIDALGGCEGVGQPIFVTGKTKEVEEEEEVDGKENAGEEVLKRRKLNSAAKSETTPIGMYEPHTSMIQYRTDTQPTRARWEVLPETPTRKRALGGTKAGNGAWALAWVDTVMELSNEQENHDREMLLREARDIVDLSTE